MRPHERDTGARRELGYRAQVAVELGATRIPGKTERVLDLKLEKAVDRLARYEMPYSLSRYCRVRTLMPSCAAARVRLPRFMARRLRSPAARCP